MEFKKKKKSLFGKVSKQKLRDNIDNIGKSSYPSFIRKKFELYKLKKGKNFLRILPPHIDNNDFYITVFAHTWIGPDKGSYLCPEKMKNEPCPICALYRKLKAKGRDDDFTKSLFPRERVVYQILDTHLKKAQSDGVLVFTPPVSFKDDILRLCQHPKTGDIIDISSAEEGYEISFEFVKDSHNPKGAYKSFQKGDKIPVDSDVAEELTPFEKIIKYAKMEKLEGIADALKAESKKPVKGEKSSKQEEEEEEESEEVDFDDMDWDEMVEYADEKDIDIPKKIKKGEDEDRLRRFLNKKQSE